MIIIWACQYPTNGTFLHLKLSHISKASFVWDIGKLCQTRSDAATCGVWSGSPLFAYRNVFQNLNKNIKKYHPATRKLEINGLVQLIRMGQYIRHKWVKLMISDIILILKKTSSLSWTKVFLFFFFFFFQTDQAGPTLEHCRRSVNIFMKHSIIIYTRPNKKRRI